MQSSHIAWPHSSVVVVGARQIGQVGTPGAGLGASSCSGWLTARRGLRRVGGVVLAAGSSRLRLSPEGHLDRRALILANPARRGRRATSARLNLLLACP